MKPKFFFIAMILLFSNTLFAQVGINTNNGAPDASAGLDVNFNNKGFLPPRMTTAQRNAIVTPAAGLVIYNTDEKALNLYNDLAQAGASLPAPNGPMLMQVGQTGTALMDPH